MLTSLHISGLVLIDDLWIDFQPGLNVLSGETGSGKSLVLHALKILLGEKPLSDIARTGTERTIIEGVFNIGSNQPLLASIEGIGARVHNGELLIRRELVPSGRGKVFINGQLASIAFLRNFRSHLVDIHGQGDQQSLLDPNVQLAVFDRFAGAEAQKAIVNDKYDRWVRLVKEVGNLTQVINQRVELLDIIDFQIREIDRSAVSLDEDMELEGERKILLNSEKLSALTSEAYSIICDQESSIVSGLVALQKRVGGLAQIDPMFLPYVDQLESGKAMLDDLAFSLSSYSNNIQSLPERMIQVNNRLQELSKLKQKYGGTLERVLATLTDLSTRRANISTDERQLQELKRELAIITEQYFFEAKKLKKIRTSKAEEFESKVKIEFEDVSTTPAQFVIYFTDTDEVEAPSTLEAGEDYSSRVLRNGTEGVEFYFSANKGEKLKPLRDTASGGELSRLMLAIKANTAHSALPKILIFDEIDSGVGGKIADAVGRRLKRLASNNQVLCITHQVQLARYADAHLLVYKEADGKRTNTKVEQLTLPARIEELARMIGGAQVTAAALSHAKELLEPVINF